MSDRLPPVFADDSSVVTARKLTIGKVKGSLNIDVVCNGGSHPSGNVCQQVPNSGYVATGGSHINTDNITSGDVDGDMNFSIKTGNPQVREGTVGETLPSSKMTSCPLVGKKFFQFCCIRELLTHNEIENNLDRLQEEGPAVKMIIEHKVELISHLMTDRFILQHVHAKEIITYRQYMNINSVSQPEEMVTKLIDHVIFDGQEACSRFLDILKVPDVLSTYPQLRDIMSKWS